VTPYYDSLVAKLVTWGADRPDAAARMVRALKEFLIVGVQTTIPFHLRILEDPRFREGRFHTRFVDDEFRFEASGGPRAIEASLLAAALEVRRTGQLTPVYPGPQLLSAWRTAGRRTR